VKTILILPISLSFLPRYFWWKGRKNSSYYEPDEWCWILCFKLV